VTYGRRRTFFDIDFQVVGAMRWKCISLFLAEYIGEVVIIFRYCGKIRNVVGEGSGFAGDSGIRKVDLKSLRTSESASEHKSRRVNQGNRRSGSGRRCRN